MMRKLAVAAILALVVSIVTAGFSAHAATCYRLTVIVMDKPYVLPTVCTPV